MANHRSSSPPAIGVHIHRDFLKHVPDYPERAARITGLPVITLTRTEGLTEGELLELAPSLVGLITFGGAIGARFMDAAPRLRVISCLSSGTDYVDIEAATRRGILVGHTPGANARATAELAFGLMFAVIRRIPESDRDVRAGRWRRAIGINLEGKTLGVLGTGQVGRRVARIAMAFNMTVIACDIRPDPALAEAGVRYVNLETLLRESDILTLHVPLDSSTRGLLSAEALSLMKPGSYLINAARGAIVDENSLCALLQAGHIAGAGIDAYSKEPPLGSPLLGLENVVCTAHMGASTLESVYQVTDTALKNAALVLRGDRPLHCANPLVYSTPARLANKQRKKG